MSYAGKIRTLAVNAIGNVGKYNDAVRKAEENLLMYPGAEGYKTALQKARAEREDFISSTLETAQKYCIEYKDAVKAYFMPDGTKLNEDVNILKSGLVMNAADYQELFERNNGNVTMQRLIAQYADGNGVELTPEMQRATFDILEQMNPHIEAGKRLLVYLDNALRDSMYAMMFTDDNAFQKITTGVMDI